MKNVAIIPARGGSKEIENKNIIDINGKPLICHSLKACFECKSIDYVAVSTDSDEISKVVREYYPDTIIIKRPFVLATDLATSEGAILHAIDILEKKISKIKNIIFVQATSPLSLPNDFSRMILMLEEFDSVAFYIDDFGFFFDVHDMSIPRQPRQLRTPLKREVGNAWAFDKNEFKVHKSRLFGNIGYEKIDPPRHLEIDTISDIFMIESILNNY
jgi:CMP-N,N'-diacetyllegionaminic acid synthase